MKINALTGTRAIAAIMVVIHHYGSESVPFSLFGKLFRSGNLAVSYFFVLSGFVLYISQRHIRYFKFLGNRLARIGPAYYIALLLTAVYFYLFYPITTDFYKELLCSALFIHAFIPRYVLELNSPSWSLSIEMVFYMLFPLLLMVARRRKSFVWLTVIALVISQAIHLYYWTRINPFTGSGIYFNPFIHLNQFMIGMVGGMLYGERPALFQHRLYPLLFLAIIIALVVCRPEAVNYHVGLIAPFFMLLIVSIAVNGVRWLSGGVAVFLGEISYSIYIYQYPVFRYLGITNQHYLHFSYMTVFYLGIIILLLVSSASYYLVELPTIRLVKRRLAPKKATASA